MKPEALSGVLTEFAQTMVTESPTQGILEHLVERIVEVMPVTAAGVTLIAPDLQPRYIAASDRSALRYEELQTQVSEGPGLAAVETGEVISVPDLGADRRFPEFAPRALTGGLAAVFAFPLRHAAVCLGALDLYRDTPGALSPASLVAAQTLADVAAPYLINAQRRADLQDAADQSRDAALHDPLTGLPNRVLMLEMLKHAFRGIRRSSRISAVFFIDLDRFKEVNDTYGHQIGDRLLVAVGERVSGLMRPGDSVGRLSGDEFLVLCESLENRSHADLIAGRLRQELSRPFILSGVTVSITASIGIAVSGQGRDGAEQLLHDADFAMYRNKRREVGGYKMFDLRDLNLAGNQSGLARGLPGALDRDELHLAYQPIVDAANGRLTGLEALMRWTVPGRGAVSPSVFIPFAERSGGITELGQWALNQACSDHQRWQRGRPEEIAVSINVSAHELLSAGFVSSVASVLDSTSTNPKLLIIEVTESLLVLDQQRALIVLDELADLGVKLALDDFGTGYSSLGYLDGLPIDTLKIDRTFIATLSHKRESQAIVTAIIQLAHGLGMTAISEGVETVEQHDQLMALGCDGCQGFYFARPMPAAALDRLLQRQADLSNPHLPILTTSR